MRRPGSGRDSSRPPHEKAGERSRFISTAAVFQNGRKYPTTRTTSSAQLTKCPVQQLKHGIFVTKIRLYPRYTDINAARLDAMRAAI
jgi:hypothetical protein